MSECGAGGTWPPRRPGRAASSGVRRHTGDSFTMQRAQEWAGMGQAGLASPSHRTQGPQRWKAGRAGLAARAVPHALARRTSGQQPAASDGPPGQTRHAFSSSSSSSRRNTTRSREAGGQAGRQADRQGRHWTDRHTGSPPARRCAVLRPSPGSSPLRAAQRSAAQCSASQSVRQSTGAGWLAGGSGRSDNLHCTTARRPIALQGARTPSARCSLLAARCSLCPALPCLP